MDPLITSTDSGDPRVADFLGRAVRLGEEPRAVLVGFPTDEGVRRNGGRHGAARAPAEIRRYLGRLTPDVRGRQRFVSLLEHTVDLGDVALTGNLEADQHALGEVVGPELRAGRFVLVLGGGHETSFGHFLGYVRAGLAPEILNWDAHPDVRPLRERLGHSGSPFRQALEHPSQACRRYSVAGLQPHSTAAEHLAYVCAQGSAIFRDECTPERVHWVLGELTAPAFVSFDIDAVDQSVAPGVSAPTLNGFGAAEWLDIAFRTGREASVQSVDVVEVNPLHDRDGQTARLAALTVWHVLRGLAARA